MTNKSFSATEASLLLVPQNPAANRQKGNVKETIELLSKALFGFAGLCYVLGLLVVTVHLRSFGLNSLTLSQLHYVTAGVWVLLPVLVGFAFIVFVKLIIEGIAERWTNLSTRRRVIEIAAAAATPVIVFYAALQNVGEPFGIQLTWTSWLFIPALGTVAFGGVAVAIVFLVSPSVRGDSTSVTATLVFGLIALFLSFGYVSGFANNTYREIPWATGGGGPSQVQLVVASDAKPYLEASGLRFSGGQTRTDSLRLILVTSSEYVVLAEGKAVSIPLASVKSVIYEK